jgi:hypothetical protein
MSDPLPAPTFPGGYSIPPTDIGSGYAAGITSAGQSIAGAIGAVMGGYNQRTGELQEGILDQKKSSEQTIEMLHTHGILDNATYEKALTSNLGAQQKIIGQYTSEYNMKLQSHLEQQNRMQQLSATQAGGYQEQQLRGTQAMDVEKLRLQGEQARTQAELAQKKLAQPGYVLPAKPGVPNPAAIPNVLSLGTGY